MQPSCRVRRAARAWRWLLLAVIALSGARGLASAAASPVATVEGTVVYADEEWGLAFVHDGARVIALETLGGPVPPRGQGVRARGVRATLRGREAIAVESWSALGPRTVPVAERLPERPSPGSGPLWGTVEGYVRLARDEAGRSFLKMAAGLEILDAHVAAPLAPASPVTAGSRVVLSGVLESGPDSWTPRRLWVGGWDGVVVARPAPDWSELPLSGLGDVLAQWRTGGVPGEVRVHGRTTTRASLSTFELQDETGRMAVDLELPDVVNAASRYEVRAFVAERRGRPVLVDARWRVLPAADPPAPATPPQARPLSSISAVRALSREQAARGLPVRLRAVVTFYQHASAALFVQDATGGLYVDAGHADHGLSPGDEVLIEGPTSPGQLAPIVQRPRISRLGRGELPPTPAASPARLATGQDDCRRVETTGVVRSVRRQDFRVQLVLAAEGQRLPVAVADSLGAMDVARLLDARVRVRAVCGTSFNWHSQLRGVVLHLGRPEDLEIVQAPASRPFELPLTTVRDVLRGGTEERWGRLARLRGIVLQHRAGAPLYLRDASGTLVVQPVGWQPVSPGDRVDVVGFPAASPFAPRLEDALLRLVGPGEPAPPVAVDSGQLLGGAHDADLVRLRTTLLNVIRRDRDTALLLRAGDVVLEARGGGDLAERPPLAPGSELEVEGVLVAHRDDTAEEPALRLALRSPADVRVLARPSWWTPARAAWASGGLLLVLLASFAWASTLRRQVLRKTEDLRRSEESYRLLAENASDVILTLDPSLRLTYVSPSVERQTGYSPEEAVRLPLSKVLAPESWAAVRREIARAAAQQGQLNSLEVEVVCKDGSRRWNEVRVSLLRDEAGRLGGFLGVARDVSARRQAQEERARLAAAVEQAAEAVVLTDEQGKIRYVNPAFERVTGYPAGEAIGATPAVLKSGAHDRAFYDGLWSTIRSGRVWEGRFTNRRKDGTLFTEDSSISPIRDAAGRTIGYVAVKRDVTRQVQLEAHLAQAQKLEAVGRLAAGVAHDFNNLLAAITGFTDLLLRRTTDEKLVTYVTGIRDAAMRGAALTRQILTFSRQSPAELRPVDLGPVVEEASRLLRALLPREVEIGLRLPGEPALVTADPNQIHQVILNLGTNGGLAMRGRGGVLSVELTPVPVEEPFAQRHPPLRAGSHVRLTVSDSGCGMNPEVVERIFEPFFTTRSNGEGTGMGLSVAHGIVHRHGGVITVDSEPGRGSAFHVYLPCVSPEGAATDGTDTGAAD